MRYCLKNRTNQNVIDYYENVDGSIGNLLFYGIKTAPANQEQERFYESYCSPFSIINSSSETGSYSA